ncbi:carbon starvation protein A [Oscillibacter hominis]|uniref:Carbon starvation protein A n=1 Tax=Oscillibacter hominis TaxID=2763056 RepID=A0A7G9B242_9FIRM|nr:carbon starvation CstA family protein [Oscillibacter hominis]QNL43623.1 carbon starvation protein A [Oscillibacter hominis]
MNALVILLIGVACLVVGYLFYGRWLAKTWGVDDSKSTPAHELEDGQDYCPAKAPVLMGHHFSSIAGAGPINGPIQAAVFGWLPVLLWVVIGGIFFGAVHDFGALFASIRNKGQSIGEVIDVSIGTRAKKLFTVFGYLVLVLVVAAFASIVASTFNGFNPEGQQIVANGQTATISLLFIVLAIIFGFLVYRRNAPLGISTLIGIVGIVAVVIIGLKCPIFVAGNVWMIVLGIYILVASVTPVWILLQPRDYLSSFLLYFMMIVAFVGVVGAHPTIDIPMFTGWVDTVAPTGTSLGSMFPALFVTIACGAVSGFHSLVASGTTAKQLNKESDALPIAYGGMLIESALAIVSLIAVGYIWSSYSSGEVTTPTQVFASGISKMVATIPGLAGAETTLYSLLVLAVSVFCLTSLDTATRLARYMFQEFWLGKGETIKDAKGYKAVLCNPYVATIITVVLGVGLGMTGYAKIWPLFGAANQLLAALALLAVCCWLGNIGKNNKMFYIPMFFMLIVTLCSLFMTIKNKVGLIMAGSGDAAAYAQGILGAALFILAIILTVEGVNALSKQGKAKAAK